MENKKVRNATKVEVDGIKFLSKLEAFTYKSLKENNIEAAYQPIKFVLLPAFQYKSEKIRAITLTPDFVGDNFIIEVKGHPNDVFPYKWKLFKWYLKENNLETKYRLFIVHNQREVKEAIEQLKN